MTTSLKNLPDIIRDMLAVLRIPVEKVTLVQTDNPIFTIDTFGNNQVRVIYSKGFLGMVDGE
jgi:hypothetical protein